MTRLDRNIHKIIIDYIVRENLIYAGAELSRIYSHPNTLNHGYVISSTSPVLIYTSEPESHLQTLRQLLHDAAPEMRLQSAHWDARGEIIPEMYGILSSGKVIVIFVREQFCHAYNVVTLPKGRHMRIASLDTAITLFYTLSFVKGLDGLLPSSPHCFADTLVQISIKTRDQGVPSKFPLFPTTCHGHQPSKASLLEAKKARVESLKRKTRKIRSGKSAQRGGTARRSKSEAMVHLDKLRADSGIRVQKVYRGRAALDKTLEIMFASDEVAGHKFANKWSGADIRGAIAVDYMYTVGSKHIFKLFIGSGRRFTVLGEVLK